jgi:DNA-binding response OmpR family regulator
LFPDVNQFEPAPDESKSMTADATSRRPSDSRRLLIVEDDPDTHRILSKLFTSRGWQVSVAGTLAEALDALDPAPELIFLDLWLPDGDGEEVIKRIRRDGLPTCVAIISGVLDPETAGKLLVWKPDMLMAKPVDFSRLLSACAPGGAFGLAVDPCEMTG